MTWSDFFLLLFLYLTNFTPCGRSVPLQQLIHEFHNLSCITEINELFHDILIYWDAPVYIYIYYLFFIIIIIANIDNTLVYRDQFLLLTRF